MTPAEQIKAIRACTGLSQVNFAVKFEIPRRTIEAWESGVRTPPEYVISLLRAAVKGSINASQIGFIIGQAVKAIQDKVENGTSDVPFEQAKRYPHRWLASEKFWIDRYGLDSTMLDAMVARAQKIIDAHDAEIIDEYRAGVVLGFMGTQKTF